MRDNSLVWGISPNGRPHPHRHQRRDYDWDWIADQASLIVDTRNAIGAAGKARVVTL